MSKEDIRWHQRFANYNRALSNLSEAVALNRKRPLSELEKQGLIQSFEYTHELAWKVMQDFFVYQGNPEIRGSRDATRQAFQTNLIEDGDGWMEMIAKKNLTSHTYNKEIAEEIYESIIARFHPLFIVFQQKMNDIKITQS